MDYRPDSKYDAQFVAQELNNFATVLKIEPKNALASDRLDLDTFESLISKFRKVVNSSAARYYDKNKKNEAATVKFDITSTIQPGSLVLTLLAQDQESGMDIFNPYQNLHRALDYVATESPKLTENPGGRIGSYESRFLGNMLGLYKTIGENDVDVTYSWSDPRLLSCGHGAVTAESANTVVAYVDSNEEHVQEETEEFITGIFTMVNLKRRRWGLIDEGSVKAGSVSSNLDFDPLKGLVVGEEYTFRCLKRLTIKQIMLNREGTLTLLNVEKSSKGSRKN